jgi:hypothetical protein
LQPDLVDVEVRRGQVAQPEGLGVADALLDAGVRAMPRIERGEVVVFLGG